MTTPGPQGRPGGQSGGRPQEEARRKLEREEARLRDERRMRINIAAKFLAAQQQYPVEGWTEELLVANVRGALCVADLLIAEADK